MGKAVQKSLAADRRRQADEAGEDLPLIQEAWYRLQGWHKAAVDRAPPPAQATLKRVTAEQVALYSRVPPPGDSIPVTIEPFAVEDGVPDEEEIEWTVKRLRNNRAGGPSRMRAENLKDWLMAARRGEKERKAETKDWGESRKNDSAGRELGAGGRASPNGVSGGGVGGGIYMAGGRPYPQGGGGLLGHRPRGGDVEGSGGDSKSPFHILHHLPQRPPWFSGRSRHKDRQPRGQADSTACSHEGGGPICDLPGPD